MSSVGQLIGGAVGFFFGGPMGAQIGIMVGGLIDPPKGPTVEGPRLNDLSVQTSTYGAPIPRIYGTIATHGNVFWLENDRLREVTKKNKQGGKGGSSQTVKTYEYFATFAVGLCEGPIDGVRRIWVGSKLIYDAGSDNIEEIIASNQAARGFRVYRGAEDQAPDPRMQADRGVTNTPAYTGMAYIVFYDFPLADYGNSLMAAQVKCEVVSDADYQTRLLASYAPGQAGQLWHGVFNPDVDIPFCKRYRSFSSGEITVQTISQSGLTEIRLNPGGTWNFGSNAAPVYGLCDAVFVRPNYPSMGPVVVVAVGPYSSSDADYGYLIFPHPALVYSGINRTSGWEFSFDRFNSVLYTLAISGSGSRRIFRLTLNGQTNSSPQDVVVDSFSKDGDRVYAINSETIYTLDANSLGLINSSSYSYGGSYSAGGSRVYVENGLLWLIPNSSSSPLECFNPETGSKIASYSIDTQGFASSAGGFGFVRDGLLYAFWAHSPLMVFQLESQQSYDAKLPDILVAESTRSDILKQNDVSTSGIIQDVRGYRVARPGTLRSAIEPLQAAWPFDVVQRGYQVAFRRRGGASVATIPASKLGARSAGAAFERRLVEQREMALQLPSALQLSYLDVAREYDNGEQRAERFRDGHPNQRDLELPIAFTANEAAQTAEVLLHLWWLERTDAEFELPPEYLGLEPADVITVVGEWGEYELRLVEINYLPTGVMACKAKFNSASVYESDAEGESGDSSGQSVTLSGPSEYELIDAPVLRDELNAPGYLVSMCGYTSGWPGGVLFRTTDEGQTWSDLQGFVQPVTMGTARNSIGAWEFGVIDPSSRLQLDLIAGELESVSEIAMLNGANYFAYGRDGRWEVVAAQTCEQQADGSWIMSDMLRGRFGTEWAASLHQAGDRVVLLTDPDIAFVSAALDSIGLEKGYRGITADRTIDSDTTRNWTYQGANLRPLSPVYLNGHRASNNDWSLSWIRRTRVGGDWRSNVDAQLGEASEAYEVEVWNAGYTTLLRTINTSSPAASYAAAQQNEDFGAAQSTLRLRIYQISATVGRGYPLQTEITR